MGLYGHSLTCRTTFKCPLKELWFLVLASWPHLAQTLQRRLILSALIALFLAATSSYFQRKVLKSGNTLPAQHETLKS